MSTFSFGALREDYAGLWRSMRIRLSRNRSIAAKAERILANRERYAAVGILPWEIIGLIHTMESDCDFDTHLHNGDPLADHGGNRLATTHEPKGRGPFESWEESARDATRLDLVGVSEETRRLLKTRSVEAALWFLEKYNGMGYRRRGFKNPYLWSATFHYTKGKYVADGTFDPEAVSQQIGAAPILKSLIETGGEAWTSA